MNFLSKMAVKSQSVMVLLYQKNKYHIGVWENNCITNSTSLHYQTSSVLMSKTKHVHLMTSMSQVVTPKTLVTFDYFRLEQSSNS